MHSADVKQLPAPALIKGGAIQLLIIFAISKGKALPANIAARFELSTSLLRKESQVNGYSSAAFYFSNRSFALEIERKEGKYEKQKRHVLMSKPSFSRPRHSGLSVRVCLQQLKQNSKIALEDSRKRKISNLGSLRVCVCLPPIVCILWPDRCTIKQRLGYV